MSAEEFITKILVARLGAGAVVVGWDFHFGKGRSGSPATLAEAGLRHGFGVEIVTKVEDQAGVVSSSAIRKALECGDLAAAAKGLGRNYSVSGQVISGQHLGRTLGVPTANIALEPSNRLARGVYAVVARVDGRPFRRSRALAPAPRLMTGRHCSRSIFSISAATSMGGKWRSSSSSASAMSSSSIRFPCSSPK